MATDAPVSASPAAGLVPAAANVWASVPLRVRLEVLRRLRDGIASQAASFAEAMPSDLSRNRADTLAAEILPLLAACKFVEREAATLLAPRRLGRRGLPFWLAGVDSTVERVPLGAVLLIAPSNYPLFLPGVQALQALAAGNAVVWKPGRGGGAAAQLFAALAVEAGVPAGTLRVTDESVEAGVAEIAARPAKIVFTGSGAAGREILRLAAEHAIPVIAELSGCDAVIGLASADPQRLAAALCFGMRLNGSATCMAPRRLILVGDSHQPLLDVLRARFAAMEPVFIRDAIRVQLGGLLEEAVAAGAEVTGSVGAVSIKPLLIEQAMPGMSIAQSDIFAPVLSVLAARDVQEALEIERACPYGLTAAVFGDEAEAKRIGSQMQVGTVLINDLIVPTADPRVPFGGRRGSGFGVTRGAEGLLEMTAVKVTLARRGKDTRHLEPTGSLHEELFGGVIALGHRQGWAGRFAGLKQIFGAIRRLGTSSNK